jgi:hypothetical protein
MGRGSGVGGRPWLFDWLVGWYCGCCGFCFAWLLLVDERGMGGQVVR